MCCEGSWRPGPKVWGVEMYIKEISRVVGIHCLCIISSTMENQMEKKIWRMKWTVGFGLVALGFLQIKGTIVGGGPYNKDYRSFWRLYWGTLIWGNYHVKGNAGLSRKWSPFSGPVKFGRGACGGRA